MRIGTVVLPEHVTAGTSACSRWTVTNQGEAVWSGSREWTDSIYFSRDPVFIAERAIALLADRQAHYLKPGESYTNSATFCPTTPTRSQRRQPKRVR